MSGVFFDTTSWTASQLDNIHCFPVPYCVKIQVRSIGRNIVYRKKNLSSMGKIRVCVWDILTVDTNPYLYRKILIWLWGILSIYCLRGSSHSPSRAPIQTATQAAMGVQSPSLMPHRLFNAKMTNILWNIFVNGDIMSSHTCIKLIKWPKLNKRAI